MKTLTQRLTESVLNEKVIVNIGIDPLQPTKCRKLFNDLVKYALNTGNWVSISNSPIKTIISKYKLNTNSVCINISTNMYYILDMSEDNKYVYFGYVKSGYLIDNDIQEVVDYRRGTNLIDYIIE